MIALHGQITLTWYVKRFPAASTYFAVYPGFFLNPSYFFSLTLTFSPHLIIATLFGVGAPINKLNTWKPS
jgi:hypothetical protein